VFPSGSVKGAQGGTITIKLSDAAVSTQFVRVLMTESSSTCDLHGSDDVRNCVGYAIQEIQAGTVDAKGYSQNQPRMPLRRSSRRTLPHPSIPGTPKQM